MYSDFGAFGFSILDFGEEINKRILISWLWEREGMFSTVQVQCLDSAVTLLLLSHRALGAT